MSDTYLYNKYYERIIQSSERGFKLVLGGTGLGKTRGIKEVVARDGSDRKYVYCANRVQLLDEMAETLGNAHIGYAHLRRNRQLLEHTLTDDTQRLAFYRLLDSRLVTSIVNTLNERYGRKHLDLRQIRQACEDIRHLSQHRHLVMGEVVERRVSQVMQFWRTVLRETGEDHKGVFGGMYAVLINEPIVQALFPYLHFKHDPEVRVLLVTLQKLFRGFFDGRKMVNIFRLLDEDSGFVIFLDEFDFLEENLIDLLCEDAAISSPFHFVEHFYRAMQRDKLPLDDYPVGRPGIRRNIEHIVGEVEGLQRQGIPFPAINQFTARGKSIAPTIVFQTNRTILEEPLYLEPTKRSWDIVRAEQRSSEESLSALDLLHMIHGVTYDILQLLKSLEVTDRVLYQELLRHCFGYTTFREEIEAIHQVPQLPHNQPTRFDSLLETGYGVFELHDLQQETDPHQVEWRYWSLYTTPEKILATLAEHNLVFGLSATADLPRYVAGFSLDWLRMQETVKVHEVDAQDRAWIQELNARKSAVRRNKIVVEPAGELDSRDPLQKRVRTFIRAVAEEEEFRGNDRGGYRRARPEHFFRTLLWIANREDPPESDSHLLFFTSYHQIEYLFKKHAHPEDVEPLWEIRPVHGRLSSTEVFQYYEIDFAGKSFVVIFYDAAKAQQIEREATIKAEFYKAFWLGKPVVLVTTYPSAGNGVNLQYRPREDSKDTELTDFRAIHLLDSPYFYFERIEREQTVSARRAAIRKNIWYLGKLFEAKIISEERFKAALANIRNAALNDRYHNDMATAMDALLNRLATFIQALGRIERIWHQMPDQAVRMSRDVWETFETFCTQPEYLPLRENRQSTISGNLRQVLQQVADQAKQTRRTIRQTQDERLPIQQRQNQEAIHLLLERLVALRAGADDPEAKVTWQELRRAVLRHDFHSKVLQEYHCLFESDYFDQGMIYLLPGYKLVPEAVWGGDTIRWNLNRVYDVCAENKVVRRYFERHGYELGFSNRTNQFLTPYCHQAILIGAVGEEAIRAILRHERLELEELPDRLFEVADLKIAKRPWYIDCKNFSDQTLDTFPLPPSDPAWRPKLNEPEFKQSAIQKLASLKRVHSDMPKQCKVIYLNLKSGDDRRRQYYDAEFQPVESFSEAQIIVIQGVLCLDDFNQYTTAFEQFLRHAQ